MFTRTWFAITSLVVAGCGAGEPSPARAPEPEASAALATLHDVAAELDRLAGTATGSADLERLPGWALIGPRGLPAPGEPPPDLGELRAIASGDQTPRIRALACLWLAVAGQIEDLGLLDDLLDTRAPAGPFPSVRITQQVQPSYPVSWQDLTLGQVALDAASTILGRRFDSNADYRRWRAEQGDLESSVAYWEGVLDAETSAEARAAKVREIRERDPELLVRLVLTADESHRRLYDMPDEDIAALVADLFDAHRLERLLRRQERWPEFAEPERFGRFAAWIFDHFEAVTGPEDRDVLLELWEAWPCPDENWVRADLALAIARTQAERREEVLLAVLEERPSAWMGEVLAELLRDGLGDRLAAVAPWFFVPDTLTGDENRIAIVGALARGPNGRADLRRLVLDQRFATDSPRVIQALIEASRELGQEIECGESIVAVGTGEVLEHAKHSPREITPEDERRARDARTACLKRIRAWLRGR